MAQPPPPAYDYIGKIVNIGDSGCGKSSLTIRLWVEFGSIILPCGPPANEAYRINNPTTAPPDTKKPTKDQRQQYLKLSIWDTAGQETWRSITTSYFRGASGALLVFDISRRNTFENATRWLNDLRRIAEEHIVIILVGNKSDLAATEPSQRQVERAEAEDWCRRNGVLQYVETSAKSGDGVRRAFLEVAERIYQNIEAGRYNLNDKRSGVKRGGDQSTPAVSLNRSGRQANKKSGVAGGCC